MGSRQPIDSGKGAADRGKAEVRNVERNLGPALYQHAHRFDPVQTAAGGAERFGDRPGRGYVRTLEIQVVGDEELACSYGAGSRSGMEFGTTQIRTPGCIPQHLLAEAFKLALANLLQQRPVGPGGGCFVKINGDVGLPPDFEAGLASENGALSKSDAAHGHKGNHIRGADARMNAALGRQINELGCFAGSPHGGLDDSLGWNGTGGHGAGMVAV